MPNLSDITVKKNDGTTDVIYAGTVPGSGDQPAVHFAPALGATSATRPELRTIAKVNKDGSVRTTKGTFMYPYAVVNTTTGVTSVVKRAIAKVEFTNPQDIPSAILDEAVSQFANLIASATWKSAAKQGYTFS